MDDVAPFESLKEIVYENTYITTPEGHGEQHVCCRRRIQSLLHSLIQTRVAGQRLPSCFGKHPCLLGQPYDPVRGAQLTKQLADDTREQVKALGYDRYKLIIEVTLGQKRGQSMRLASRSLWNTKTDTFVNEVYEEEDVYCSIQVYVLYHE